MTQDRRAELLEKIDAAFAGGLRSNETMVAHAVLDIALKVAADEVQGLADKWNREWREGYKANSHLEGKSDGADEAAEAIRAITSEGTKG
jgi:hypothetical protein